MLSVKTIAHRSVCFLGRIYVKTDEPPWARWTELSGWIWPAGRTLPTPALTLSLNPNFNPLTLSLTLLLTLALKPILGSGKRQNGKSQLVLSLVVLC